MTFGIAIVLLAMQNPVAVAETAASLDWITDGNYVLGIGIGYRPEEFEALGVPFDDRRSRFEEAIPLIRRLWTEPRVTHHGSHFSVSGLGASIRPKQAGGCPIWIGGDAAVAVRRAARMGCAWVVPPTMHADVLARCLDQYVNSRRESGVTLSCGQPAIRECVIGRDRVSALESVGSALLAKYESYAGWGQMTAAGSPKLADHF